MVALAFVKLDEVHALLVRIADERGLLARAQPGLSDDLTGRVRAAKSRDGVAA